MLALVDLAPPEQVIQAAHPIPAIAIRLDDEPVFAVLIALTVLLGQQIHEDVSEVLVCYALWVYESPSTLHPKRVTS